MNNRGYTRRTILRTGVMAGGALALPGLLSRRSYAGSEAIRIGFVSPRTGPVAAFGASDDYVLKQVRAAIGAGIFTPVVLQMIAVGEESGAVDDMMEEVGDMYRQEVEYELKTLSQQIEPILIVALGVMVLILALGVFLPMWDLGKVAIKR